MDALTNGVTIKVGSATYHSFTDFGLAIGNNDYIGEPEYETHYVDIPGRDGFLDLSEAIADRVIYKNRKISIEFGGKGDCNDWDAVISDIRNKIHGRTVQLVFDNDPDWYWTGRAEINDYDRFRNLATFKLEIPQADPYKYGLELVTGFDNISVGSSMRTIVIPVTGMRVNPSFVVEDLANLGTNGQLYIRRLDSDNNSIAYNSVKENGTYRFHNLWYESGDKVGLSIGGNFGSGSGTVSIVYRQVSL